MKRFSDDSVPVCPVRTKGSRRRRCATGIIVSALATIAGCAQPLSESLRNPAQAMGLQAGASVQDQVGSTAATPQVTAGDPAAVDHDRRMAAFEAFGIEEDIELKRYLNGLLKAITTDAGMPDSCCRVEIFGAYSLDAYSKPSGTVFVPIGWLLAAESEDELVALLAHETGHIARNHYNTDVLVTGTIGLRQLYLAGTAVFAVATKTKISLTFDQPLQYTALVTSSLIHPALSRDQELEADRFAVDTTVHLGYRMKDGPKAFLERFVTLEESAKRAADAQAAQSPVAQQMKDYFASLSRKHDTAQDRLNAAIAYYESLPPMPALASSSRPAARALAGKAKRVDGWRSMQQGRTTARLLAAYRASSEADERVAAQRYVEAAVVLKTIDAKLTSTRLPLLMSQCKLDQAAGNLAKAGSCMDGALAGNFGSWRLYETRSDLMRRSGNASGALALLEDGYRRLATPPEALPTLIEFSRDIDVKKRDDYNGRCLLTDVRLRQACADALTSPAQKQAAADAEAKRITDKIMAPVTKGLDKITPKSR